MIGAVLSRWTMLYFATALLSLLAAEAMMSAGLGFPAEALRAPATLVVVHLVTIGWLSLTMCGALGQFIPVLTERPLHSNRLPLPALAVLVTGLAALILGFLRLDGRVSTELPFLSVAALLLGAGFSLVIYNLARTLWSARPLALPARFMATGLAAVGVAATLGMIFALVLDQAMTGSVFVRIHSGALPIHIIAGLGGWLTITTVGVSYRLLAMFMLAPDIDDARGRVTLWSASAALGIAVAGGFAAVLVEISLAVVLATALVLATLALALYGREVLQLYRTRRRRSLELNSRMGAIALANLALSALLCVVLTALGRFAEYVGAVVFLSAFGWLSGFMLAQMYKIVAFLTWLEVYGPVLGKAPTPRVQDLVAERPAMRWFTLFFAGVWGATGALLAGSPPIFRIAALAMTAATCGIVLEMMKSRRLSHVPTALRFPGNALRPMLLIAATEQAWKEITMTTEFVDVDVRPILRAGGEPFSVIMQAVEGLEPGQGMRLFATFKPIPLFGVLGSRGFSHEAIELNDGEWEVLFRPGETSPTPPSVDPGNDEASVWPEPSIDLDNRDLDPPEPMARILEATERLKAGEVLSALLLREPRFLFPELARRGHQWRGGFDPERTTYRILVRVGSAVETRG